MLKGLRGVPDHPSVSLTVQGEYRRGAVQSSFSSTRMPAASDSGLIIANEVPLKGIPEGSSSGVIIAIEMPFER